MAKDEKAFKALKNFLDKEGILVFTSPVFIKRDDGTFSLAIHTQVKYKDENAQPIGTVS